MGLTPAWERTRRRLPLEGRPHLAAACGRMIHMNALVREWVIVGEDPLHDYGIGHNVAQLFRVYDTDLGKALEQLAANLELVLEHGALVHHPDRACMAGVRQLMREPFTPARHRLALCVVDPLAVRHDPFVEDRWEVSIRCTLQATSCLDRHAERS